MIEKDCKLSQSMTYRHYTQAIDAAHENMELAIPWPDQKNHDIRECLKYI